MTAPEVVSGWPEATVERVAEAETLAEWLEGWCDHVKDDGTTFGPECCPWRKAAATVRSLAAALSVLPDPTADTVLLDQVREFCDSEARTMIAHLNAYESDAKWAAGAADAHNAVLTFIAALLAGGGE